MKPLYSLIVALTIAVFPCALQATQISDTMICKNGIVSVGDLAIDLLKKCGQPAYKEQRKQKISEQGNYPGERIKTTIIIDDWTYNFGPNQFQYRILLKNGRIRNIETLDYGY